MFRTHTYSRQEMLSFKSTNYVPYPNSVFKESRNHAWIKKRKRAGWQCALNYTPPVKMTVPSLVSTNVRSLFAKISDLTCSLNTRIHSNTCVACIQETWLNQNVEDALVQIDGFVCYRQDRQHSRKKTGGGVATYINTSWSGKSEVIFSFSEKSIDCLSVRCHPRFSRFKSTIITNVYIAPSCSQSDISSFFDHYIPFLVPILDENLHLVVGDFNHANIFPLLSFGLSDLSHSPTRGNSILDKMITNHPNLFSLKLMAPVSTSDHCVLLLRPKIYSRSTYPTFIRSNQIRFYLRNLSLIRISLLYRSIAISQSRVASCASLLNCISLFTETMKSIFNLCCPMEMLFVCDGKISSPLLKSLRRQKERSYKFHHPIAVKHYSNLIKVEITRLNKTFASQILQTTNTKLQWQGIRLLCGQKRKNVNSDVDVNSLNAAFLHPSTDSQIPSFPCEVPNSDLIPFSNEEIFKLLRSFKPSSSAGPDGLSPAFLKFGAASLTSMMTSLINESLSSQMIPDSWRPVTIIPIPKASSSTVLAKRFRPIALTSVVLKLTEKAILSRLQSLVTLPHDPLQFAYKPNRSTLDAVSTLVHYISKSLNSSVKSVRCVFLDYSSAFDSVSRSSLLFKLESFGTPRQLLSWLSDYFTERTQCTKLGKNTSSPLLINSGVLQGAVLSPYLFSAFISDLSVPNPAHIQKYADDVVLCQTVSSSSEFSSFTENLSQIQQFSNNSGLHLNTSKCLECIFSSSRSTFPLDNVTLNDNHLSRVTSVKYLGITIDNDLRWSTHIQNCIGKLRRLSFQLRKLRQFRTPQNLLLSFVNQCVLPILLYCSPVVFPGLLKQDFKTIRRGLMIISRASLIPVESLITELIDGHIKSCMSLANKILNDPSHPLHLDLSSCRSHSITRSSYRYLPSRINIYKNSPVPYLARLLTNKERVLNELRQSLLV